MAKRDAPKDAKTETDLSIVQITETTSRIRWLSVCFLLAFFGWMIRDGYVAYLNSKTPTTAGERMFGQVVTAVVCLIAPSGLIAYLSRRVRKFTRRVIGRLTRLEEERDPGRTSSGLQQDGTDPPGATP